jgi:hypothetical protein
MTRTATRIYTYDAVNEIALLIRLATLAVILIALPALAADAVIGRPPLDHGFHLLYSLDFDGAHNIFAAWEQSHPDDPMGPTADAAGILFSEFHRLGVLESQFLRAIRDLRTVPGRADTASRSIQRCHREAQNLAQARLAKNPRDGGALPDDIPTAYGRLCCADRKRNIFPCSSPNRPPDGQTLAVDQLLRRAPGERLQ